MNAPVPSATLFTAQSVQTGSCINQTPNNLTPLAEAERLLNTGAVTEAFLALNEMIEGGNKNPFAHFYRGNLFLSNGHYEAALLDYEACLSQIGGLGAAYNNVGTCLTRMRRLPEAARAYQQAATCAEPASDAWANLGNVQFELGELSAAHESYSEYLKHNPKKLEVLLRRATILVHLSRAHEAKSDFEASLQLDPHNSDALCGLGTCCLELKDLPSAINYFTQVIQLKSDLSAPVLGRGLAYFPSGQHAQARADFDKAIDIDPDHAHAYMNRGHLRVMNRDFEGAVKDYEKIADRPDTPNFVEGDLIVAKMQTCNWEGLSDLTKKIEDRLREGRPVATPFALLSFSNKADVQKKCSEVVSAIKFPQRTDIDDVERYTGHTKIRVGYFSADYCDHATMHLMGGLFEMHDKSRFETFAFSFGPQKTDQQRIRAELAFDHFIDASLLSDKAVSLIARHLEIDIAIDLKGYTTHSRPGIFAYRAAPIQVNFLGFPGTMGAPYIDYLIADRTIIPTGLEDHYSESVLAIDGCYQVNDSKRMRPIRQFTRAELNLPEDAFVFCSFNNNFKITPEMFDLWCKLLRQVPDSVLWMLADNPAAQKNLMAEAKKRGVEPSRLIFASRMSNQDHLARHAAADLLLDTFPCNAHTTASDALFMGVPLVTLMGETFASRVAASILKAAGHPELVAQSMSEYETIALRLARNPEQCRALKASLLETVPKSQLYDTARFTKDYEAILESLMKRSK